MRRKHVFWSMVLLALTGCSGTGALNLLNNAEGYRARSDVAYGPAARQSMDIYEPEQAASRCVVMFVYGGSWEEGSKSQYGFLGATLAKRGYTVVIPDYRLYPQVAYPAFVEDIAMAVASEPVQQLLENRRLIMMGHSAGAMMAGLVSYNPKYLKAQGLSKSLVSAYIAIAGPHDYFLPTDKPRWTKIFSEDKQKQRTALTVEHVHADNPPTLILHGAEDETVTPKSATSLANKLKDVGVPVEKTIYEDVNHVRIMAAFGWPLRFLAPTAEDVEAFLEARCR